MIVRQPISIGGSGSSYIYGFVDANFKVGMQKDECIRFVANGLLALIFKLDNNLLTWEIIFLLLL